MSSGAKEALMVIDGLLFDLDGTLWDTCATCAVGWNNVVRRQGIQFREITAEDIRRVCGKPHDLCVKEIFAGLAPEALAPLVQETAEEDNRVIREIGGELFPGVLDGLVKLRKKYCLFIVSNCQSGYIETFLELNKLEDIFSDFECWGDTGRTKAENIRAVVERNQLVRPLYIGDTPGDALAASGCGLPFAFVSYGFGRVANAPLRFSSFAALTEYFLTL